jgi:hypothetical protein
MRHKRRMIRTTVRAAAAAPVWKIRDRGYDLLADASEVGQQVIPIVRDEVAKRDVEAA